MKITLYTIFLTLFLTACGLIEYSPYQLNFTDKSNLNIKNIKKIQKNGKQNFKFAIFSDSHFGYDELNMAVEHINKRGDIDFVIHLGDSTDHGLSKEYELSDKILSKLKMPYIVTLGNHDTLHTGKEIFYQLYGEPDISFIANSSKFVILNSNSWEFPDENIPDLDWLQAELADRYKYKHLFVLTHIAPFVRGFDKEKEERYKTLMVKNSVSLSIHGHNHKFKYYQPYEDGIDYLLLDDVMDHFYALITVESDRFYTEWIHF